MVHGILRYTFLDPLKVPIMLQKILKTFRERDGTTKKEHSRSAP